MKVEFNHTIVHSRDKNESARFVADVLGLPKPIPFGHFLVVQLTNGASLDFIETDEPFMVQHYAFLVGELEFAKIFERVLELKIPYWADPMKKQKEKVNNYFGGRGFYFEEPSGNFLEVITRPYDYFAK